MNVFEDKTIRDRLTAAFPQLYVNYNFEIIIYPPRNSYFLLSGVETERDLTAKILEWLSREACKSIDEKSQVYHLNGINTFLGTNFTREEMMEVYTWLGNAINHDRTLRFIDSGYNLAIFPYGKNPNPTEEELDDKIDYWHSHKTGVTLREFIGMTDEEYGKFLRGESDGTV